jgi:hypothetical protein
MKLQARHLIVSAVVAIASARCIPPVLAQPVYEQTPDKFGIYEPSIATNLPQRGDPYGIRKYLFDHGVAYNVIYTNDVLGNTRGGIRRGSILRSWPGGRTGPSTQTLSESTTVVGSAAITSAA